MSGLKAEEIARRMDLCGNTVRYWINRFNARGLDGLEEDVRTGRPPTYSAEQRSAVITAALTRPTELGLPFACWIGWSPTCPTAASRCAAAGSARSSSAKV
jgi:transposase